MEFESSKELHVPGFNHKRCRLLTKCAVPSGRGPVLYWMSRDQRVQGSKKKKKKLTCCSTFCIHADNWALIYAQKLALKRSVPLIVCFCLVPKFLDATIRQFGFMLKGLRGVEQVKYNYCRHCCTTPFRNSTCIISRWLVASCPPSVPPPLQFLFWGGIKKISMFISVMAMFTYPLHLLFSRNCRV